MLLNARQMAYLGLLLAICEVLLYLSAVLSINTLALLFLAACCVGVACALSSAAGGGVFFLASLLLGLVLIPNKLYLLTYTGLGVYAGRRTAKNAAEMSGLERMACEAGSVQSGIYPAVDFCSADDL